MGLIICVVGCERFILIITGPTKLAVFNCDFGLYLYLVEEGSYVWVEINFKIEDFTWDIMTKSILGILNTCSLIFLKLCFNIIIM